MKVLAAKTNCEKELKAWEQDYVLNHNLVAPSYEIMKFDNIASVLLKKIKYAKALLKEWHITF